MSPAVCSPCVVNGWAWTPSCGFEGGSRTRSWAIVDGAPGRELRAPAAPAEERDRGMEGQPCAADGDPAAQGHARESEAQHVNAGSALGLGNIL